MSKLDELSKRKNSLMKEIVRIRYHDIRAIDKKIKPLQEKRHLLYKKSGNLQREYIALERKTRKA
jgi:hypothetical protein